jgi:hypothetical protein
MIFIPGMILTHLLVGAWEWLADARARRRRRAIDRMLP